MQRRLLCVALAAMTVVAGCDTTLTPQGDEMGSLQATGRAIPIGINIVLNTPVTDGILADLALYGPVLNIYPQINVVRIRGSEDQLGAIRALAFVKAADPDTEAKIPPEVTLPVSNFLSGLSMWNLDAINVTNPGNSPVRTVSYDGSGVIVGVVDSGLLSSWRNYFPEDRILVEYARSFGGGGTLRATVSEQPNKWEYDTNSHGTIVTSAILGFKDVDSYINGVAPMVKVIPVKVLNQNGFAPWSVIIEGILYMVELKEGPFKDYPVVVNISIGGRANAALEEAIEYAVGKGVIVVAAAGNEGDEGMSYPGAYSKVISVAASGWTGEWLSDDWYLGDVADPTNASDFYITDFSSRAHANQYLDIAAPGSQILGPYQQQQGKTSYFIVRGTSIASPHVAGTVALMAQKKPNLTPAEAESVLKGTAIPLAPGCRMVTQRDETIEEICWGSDATGAGLLDADAALVGL